MKKQMEENRAREIDEMMAQAAIKIQRAYRRKKEGRTMILHIKDVMKKLIEAEKAKARLSDMISNMQDETMRYFHSYLIKNNSVSSNNVLKCYFLENNQDLSLFPWSTNLEEVWKISQKTIPHIKVH